MSDQSHPPDEAVPKENLLEGGSTVEPLKAGGTPQPILLKGPFDIEKHRGRITVWLIALLAFIIVGNYACILVMEWNGKKPESLNNAFNSSLPVVSGLVGSAIAYYFTKSKETR